MRSDKSEWLGYLDTRPWPKWTTQSNQRGAKVHRIDEAPDKTPPTAIEYRQMIRAMLDHENDLINSRYDWLLTTQSLLLGAMALADDTMVVLNAVIFATGLVSALTNWRILQLANKSVENLIETWANYETAHTLGDLFPAIYGLYERGKSHRFGFLPWQIIPPGLAFGWIVLALAYFA